MSKFLQYIQESKHTGKRIEEVVKGSLDYARYEIEQAFRSQFPEANDGYFFVSETFDDHVIVSGYQTVGTMRDPLKADEYYSVSFSRTGETIIFQPREQWVVVELAYQPQTVSESVWRLLESAQAGARTIRIDRLMTAGEINGNNRRYPASVLKAAVDELKTHLHESAGQGRLMLLGEVEHPEMKGSRHANLMETIIRWTNVDFDGTHVNATGLLATETEGGRHIQALAAIGVAPGGSIRAYGALESVRTGNRQIDECKELHITGIDIVSEASFKNSQTIIESVETNAEENKMNLLEKLLAMLKARPDLFKVGEVEMRAMTESQLETLWGKISEALEIDPAKLNISEALTEMVSKARKFEDAEKKTLVETAIAEATKDLPYGVEGNKSFVEALQAAQLQDAAAVKSLVESKRAEYDKLFAGRKLENKGWTSQITGIRPVLEAETGTPEFARAAFEISESVRRETLAPRHDWQKPRTINEELTLKLLEKFDRENKLHLMREARMLQEAETTTDLSLPYSVSRAVIEEAFPDLVALGVFDVGITDQAPAKIFYETFSGETGYTASISADENVTITLLDTWYDLAHKRITPSTFVVKNAAENVTYAYGTDFVVDFANGRIKALTGGGITALDVVHVTAYSYTAIRKGENLGIERGKLTLSSKTLEIMADRLADEISREAIVFGRSQLGWDAVGRTLASLINQVKRKVDGGLIYLSLSAVLSVANNSAGTWTAGNDSLDDLVAKLGVARVKVANRYYAPTAYLSSLTNVEKLSHWDGFTAAGQRPGDERMGNGFAGSVNGLPVFWSTEHPDGYFQAINRQIVMHRIFQAMLVKGPYPSFDADMKIKANDQYYVEEFNGSDAPVPEKGAYVVMA